MEAEGAEWGGWGVAQPLADKLKFKWKHEAAARREKESKSWKDGSVEAGKARARETRT